MANRLPPWVVSNEESVRREVARYRDMSPEERAKILVLVCRDAAILAEASGRADEIRRWRDPLPESSVRALERLRREFRAAHPEMVWTPAQPDVAK